ncbi:MAG: BMP family ABC transporter substrate-binding protein [Anaerolineaceae bacterium]|nr:BMP family ABC transporter substrate-binding protein [Anaerolineaceae bacterium]
MSKKIYVVLAVILLAAMVLSACKPAAPAAETKMKVCEVTDTGGVDDRSFNATAWEGALMAQKDLGFEAKYLESQQQTDYEKNINAFIEEKCDLIVTVGYLLGDATKAAAEKNPNQKFAIVDYGYDPVIPNVLALTFQTDQAAFLAGYVAAASTKTGKVGTFGGIQIPTVTIFMDGLVRGVQYYNEKNGTKVEVLGWDVDKKTGLFTGNFESTDDGRKMGETLMDEGADIIMPVAGPVGLGAAAAVKERGNAWIIGVDTDWTVSAPDYKDIILTSVVKKIETAVFTAAKQVQDGTFKGGFYSGVLSDNGVGLPDTTVWDDKLKGEVEALQKGIIDGSIKVAP